ncbi:MAG: hypothetical protein Q8O33_05515 [Pseudomonadota bacterium]|nr:hypothetical protein [Pseudomonadota bacterium]
MTIGFAVSITLGAGLHAAGGPVVLRRGFAAAWGTTEVFASNATTWDLARNRAWQHEIGWTLRFAGALRMPYGLRLDGRCLASYGDLRLHCRNLDLAYGDARLHRQRLDLPYGEARRHRVCMSWPYDEVPVQRLRSTWPYGEVAVLRGRFEFPSGEVAVLRKRHRVPYADLGACRQAMRLAWWLTEAITGCHALGYGVTDVNPVVRRHTASWSLLADQHLQAVVNTPELLWQGRTLRILQATLSCDEDSPVWIASVELAALADFAAIDIGDAITVLLGQETFHLMVDGKTLSRESQTSQRYEVTAISPLALLDAPFAGTIRFYRPEAVSAREAVENLIDPVDWQLPDWLIPAGRLLLEGVTPLAAARSLVAAIGGIVESAPDGSVLCRRRHPVSIPGYGQAAVAHPLFDADVLASRARIAPARGYNRVTLANEEGATGSAGDRIEYVVDPEDDNRGTLRVYLENQLASGRPVLLTHTGHPATVIAALGEVVRPEREVVEFIEGRASTRYPVLGLVSHTWRHADLGAVTAEGQSLIAAVPGYSLLDLTYTTRTLDWRVALAADEEVQFVLVDA